MTDATQTTSSLAFCLRLARAYANLTRRVDGRLSSLHGLSFGDFMVLFYLERADGHRLRRIDLAERLGLTASGVTRTLLPLEKIGLVTREPDPRDARVGYATLTAAGQRMLADARESAEQVCQEATRSLPAGQLTDLSGLLATLAGTTLAVD